MMTNDFWIGFEKRAMGLVDAAKAVRKLAPKTKNIVQKAVTTAEHAVAPAVGHVAAPAAAAAGHALPAAVPAATNIAAKAAPAKTFTSAQLQAPPHYSDPHELHAARQAHKANIAANDSTANKFQKGVGLVDSNGAPLPVKTKGPSGPANPTRMAPMPGTATTFSKALPKEHPKLEAPSMPQAGLGPPRKLKPRGCWHF